MLIAESTFEQVLFGTILIVVLFAIRVGLHFADKSNVNKAARCKGWKQIEVVWRPFAPGWLFEKGERYYEVAYVDREGRKKSKYCKTGLLTGVYWRD